MARRRRRPSQAVPGADPLSPFGMPTPPETPSTGDRPPAPPATPPGPAPLEVLDAEVDEVHELPTKAGERSRILDPTLLSDEVDDEPVVAETPPTAAPPVPQSDAGDALEDVIEQIIGEAPARPAPTEEAPSFGEEGSIEGFEEERVPAPSATEVPVEAPEPTPSVPPPASFDDEDLAPPPFVAVDEQPGLALDQDDDLWARFTDQVGVPETQSHGDAPPSLDILETSPAEPLEALPPVDTDRPADGAPTVRAQFDVVSQEELSAMAEEQVDSEEPDKGAFEVDENALIEEAIEEEPDVHLTSFRARLGGSNVLPLPMPDAKDKIDEVNHALGAFADLQFGQTAMIRFSVRSVSGFKNEATAWLRARKHGEDPDAAPESVPRRILGYLGYFAKHLLHAANEAAKPGSGGEPPRAPWSRGKNLNPLPSSQVDEDEKQAWKDANKKRSETAHFEVVMRAAAFGGSEHSEDLDMIAEQTAAGFEAIETPHQNIVWETGNPRDAALGFMGARPPADVGMILSAAELGNLAHIPDDLMNVPGVQVSRSPFKHLPIPQPILIEDPLNPPPGLIPIGVVGAGSDDEKVIAMDNATLDQHMIVVGKTGSGKSEWMKWILYGIAKADYPLVVIDPHGQLSEEILNALIVNCPDRLKDIVYCDLSNPQYPVALNPLDVHSMSQVESTVGSVVEMLGSPKVAFDKGGAPRAMVYAKEALTALCHANLELDDPLTKCTLLDVMNFFTVKEFRHLVVEFCQNDVIRQKYDFDNGPFEQLGDKAQLEHVQPIIRAISELGNSESFSAVFSSPQNKLDFSRLIGGNKIVIVKLAQFAAGGQAELGSFVGSLILPWLLSSMDSWGRKKDPITGVKEGRGCRVLVDEAPTLMGPNSSVPETLAQSRKWDLGLFMAAQFLDQFDGSIIDAALGNTNSKVSLVQDPNKAGKIATAIAGASSRITAKDVAGLPNYHFYGNVLLPSGPTGPFSAKALMPIDDKLRPGDIKVREQVIEASRAIVANDREEIRRVTRQRLDNVMNALKTKLRERADTDYTPPAMFTDDDFDEGEFGWSG